MYYEEGGEWHEEEEYDDAKSNYSEKVKQCDFAECKGRSVQLVCLSLTVLLLFAVIMKRRI